MTSADASLTGAGLTGRRAAQRARGRSGRIYFLLPALALLAAVFLYPMIDIVLRSLAGPHGMSLLHYRKVIDHPVYLRVFVITFEIALSATVATLVLGYPLAYLLVTARKNLANLVMGCILVSFFTNVLVRTYSWMLILGPQGVLNQGLNEIGLGSLNLLYNRYGVLIGMSYALLPYMVLTLYSVMRGIDLSLLRAAHGLGAGDWRAFRRVFLPLSLPGVAGGSLLVFVLSIGYFITPRLLGGAGDQMVAMVIEEQVELGVDWGFASAIAVILLGFTILGFLLYDRLVGLKSLFESKL